MGLTGRSHKKRERYRKEKLAQFQAINAQYDLGLTYEQMNAAAWNYADQRVKSERKWYESGSFWTGFFKAVVMFAISFFTFGSTGYAGFANLTNAMQSIAAISSYALSFSMLVYGSYISYKMSVLAFDINSWQNKVDAKKMQNEIAEQKSKNDQLTDFLINATYEIFPNGSIYKAQSAGDMNSFSPSIAYYGAKGITGEFKSDSTDEHILNRGHYENAGNDGFMTALTGAKEYRAQGGLSPKAQMQIEQKKLVTKAKRTSEGFTKLIEAEFATYYGEGVEELFERIMDKKIQPHAKAIADVDFMDKMKNYKRALMADFSFMNPDLLNPLRKKGEMKLWQFADEFANFEKAQQTGTLQERAKAYLRSINLWIRTLKTYTRNTQDFTYHFSAFIPDSAYKISVQAPTGLLGNTLDSSSFAMQEFNKIKPQLEQRIAAYEKERAPFLKEWWEAESESEENQALEKLKILYESFIKNNPSPYYQIVSTTFYNFVTLEESLGKNETGLENKYTYHPFTKHKSGFSAEEEKEEKESQEKQENPNPLHTQLQELQEQIQNNNPQTQRNNVLLNSAKRVTSTTQQERKTLENHLFREGSGQELLERYKSHFKFMDFNHSGADYTKYLSNLLSNLRVERKNAYVNVKLNAVREFWQIPLNARATQVLGKPLPMDERLKTFDFSVL